jgi:RimJ/RimL family protein N-acetyltransferase
MDDLEAMHSVLSDSRATRYWSTPPHVDLETTRLWLESMVASPAELSEDFVVELQGRVIGKAGFYRLPEIGYILHPDHWGRGLAYEALSAIIERTFSRFEIPALTADCDPRNTASHRLLEKLGFREVRREKNTWFIAGEWCDSIYLELRRPEG